MVVDSTVRIETVTAQAHSHATRTTALHFSEHRSTGTGSAFIPGRGRRRRRTSRRQCCRTATRCAAATQRRCPTSEVVPAGRDSPLHTHQHTRTRDESNPRERCKVARRESTRGTRYTCPMSRARGTVARNARAMARSVAWLSVAARCDAFRATSRSNPIASNALKKPSEDDSTAAPMRRQR
jgi:hypothetical protein